LFLQTISCSVGTIEAKPEATKFSIQNNSTVQLLSVKWNNTDFGNIGLGELSEMIVPHGDGPIYFNTSKGKYCTHTYVIGKKHEHNKFTFIDNTIVIDVDNTSNIGILGGTLNVD